MPIRCRATRQRDQIGRLLAGQGLPSSLLYLIIEHQVEPAFGKAVGNVFHGRLGNGKRLGNLRFIPSIGQFQQGPDSSEGARVRFALSHKLLGFGTLRFAERKLGLHLSPPQFVLSVPPVFQKLNGLPTSIV